MHFEKVCWLNGLLEATAVEPLVTLVADTEQLSKAWLMYAFGTSTPSLER